jgi:hypothetical protein
MSIVKITTRQKRHVITGSSVASYFSLQVLCIVINFLGDKIQFLFYATGTSRHIFLS